MSTVIEGRVVEGSSRTVDVVAHLSPLLVAIVAAAVVGQPIGWIAFLVPLGPLLVAGALRVAGRPRPRGVRSLLAFSALSGLLIGGGWALTEAKDLWPPFAIVFPLGLLAFVAGLVNFVMIVLSRTWRAGRGLIFDYPWIPSAVAERVGLDPELPE